jgi:hypothetical protein
LFPTAHMARRRINDIITGNDPELRMCFYYSPHYGLNIWRRGSSLTGERTKTDPAFKGFRKSSSRLKEASPIAASLYKLVPEHVKQYSLYRTLTGEAIRMLKEGMEAVVIIETLKRKYIDPLLDAPKENENIRAVEEHTKRDSVRGITDFTAYPQLPAGNRKMTRKRRFYLLQKITEGQSAEEYFSFTGSNLLQQPNRKISESPLSEPQLSRPRTKTTNGLIYLGRLPECKKLKMWLLPVECSA